MNPLTIFAGPMGMVYKWLVIVALIAAFGAWSYTKGISRESDRRDALELKQVQAEHDNHAKLAAYGALQARRAQLNQAAAEDYQQKWKEARNASKRSGTPLAVTDCPAASPKPDAAGNGLARPSAPIALRLTWEFVSLWDSAYTASDGQPLYGDTARTEKAAAGAGAASPYSLDDLTDNHGENVKRWDTCRRQLRALVDTISGLERKWGEQHLR